MSRTRVPVTVGVVGLVAFTAACGAGQADDTTERKVSSTPLMMTAGPSDDPTESATSRTSGSAAVAADAVRAIADQDAEAYCRLFETGGKASTPAQVEECVETTESALTDELATLARAAVEAGPDQVEEFGERATVTYSGFDPQTIDLVKIGRRWYVTHE